ncbi:MAG TPA: hypothetical protein VLG09_00390 [Candidatus Saccharimonadales bacterium]|nr:hypothetical protein [Candidatus Saccharimonadales bacterium]
MPEQTPSFIEINRVDAAPLTEDTDASFHESNLPYSFEQVRDARLAAAVLFEVKKPEKPLTISGEILTYNTRLKTMRYEKANGIPAPEKLPESRERFDLAA